MSWQSKVAKEGNTFEQDVDIMLKELGYTPIKIYQRKGLSVKDPNGKIDRLYPDSLVKVVILRLDGLGIILNKVVLADGWYWHNKNTRDDRDRRRKDELYVAAGFWVVHVSDHWFKSESKKAEVRPMLDEAMKSIKKVEDYLAT